MLKKVHIYLFLLLLSIGANAQYSISVQALVLDTNNIPIPYQKIIVESQNGGYVFKDSIYSDSSGLFAFNKSQTIPVPNCVFKFSTYDPCISGLISQYGSDSTGVNNFVICSSGSGTTCKANMTYTQDSINPLIYYFQDLSTGIAGGTISWEINNVIAGIQSQFSYTFQNQTVNSVCLIVQSANVLCTDSICATIHVNECSSSFTYQLTGMSINLLANSNPNATLYDWDFGDGQSSSVVQSSVQHTYSQAGNYLVKLTSYVIGADTCISTDSQVVQVVNSNVGDIYGYVFAGSNYVDNANCFLYEFDSISNHISIVDSTFVTIGDSGLYFFQDVPFGTYLVYAKIGSISVYYGSFYSGWSDTSAFWQLAKRIKVNSDSFPSQALIKLPSNQVQISLGTGYIEGAIFQNPASSTINLEHVIIYLLTEDYIIIDAHPIQSSGYYKFDDLPYGDYRLLPEYPGLLSQARLISLNPANNQIQSVNWIIDTLQIATGTGVVKEPIDFVLEVFPNPSSDFIILKGKLESNETLVVRLLGMDGQELLPEIILNEACFEKNISLKNLPKGMYIIEVSNGVSKRYKKIIRI